MIPSSRCALMAANDSAGKRASTVHRDACVGRRDRRDALARVIKITDHGISYAARRPCNRLRFH